MLVLSHLAVGYKSLAAVLQLKEEQGPEPSWRQRRKREEGTECLTTSGESLILLLSLASNQGHWKHSDWKHDTAADLATQRRACALAAVPEAEVTPQRSGGCDGGCEGGGWGGCCAPQYSGTSRLGAVGSRAVGAYCFPISPRARSPAVRDGRVPRSCRSHTGPGCSREGGVV